MVNDKNTKIKNISNSSNSLVFGRWPQAIMRKLLSLPISLVTLSVELVYLKATCPEKNTCVLQEPEQNKIGPQHILHLCQHNQEIQSCLFDTVRESNQTGAIVFLEA